jgi:hypothetical protein
MAARCGSVSGGPPSSSVPLRACERRFGVLLGTGALGRLGSYDRSRTCDIVADGTRSAAPAYMHQTGIARSALKRGALVTAANWQVVVIQTIGDSAFKLLLAVPVLGGALLVTLLMGQDLASLLERDARDLLAGIAEALLARPWALVGFSLALGFVGLGGSVVMFLIKAGTVSVLVDAELSAGPIEHPPLRLSGFQRAMRFSIERYTTGASVLFRRYLALGCILIAIYVASMSVYALIVYAGYRNIGGRAPLIGWTFAVALLAVVLAIWTTAVNLVYLLTQIVVAATGNGVPAAVREVFRFLRTDFRPVLRIFVAALLLVVLVTGLSLVATASLGFIAFVPLAGVAVLPLQLVAWLLRNLVFQFLGLMALSAYLSRYRRFAAGAGRVAAGSSDAAETARS